MADDEIADDLLVAAAEQVEQQLSQPIRVVCCYTDGCCLGNGKDNSVGGWGFLACEGPKFTNAKAIIHQDSYGSNDQTTNNKMEMTAVLKAMQWLLQYRQEGGRVVAFLHSDSEYTLTYIHNVDNWERRKWKTAGGGDVKNQDLWTALRAAERQCIANGIDITFVKVRAHQEHGDPDYDEGNERADNLANDWHVKNTPGAAERRRKAKQQSKSKNKRQKTSTN